MLRVTIPALDASNHLVFRQALADHIRGGSDHLLDLAEVTFMDSAALGALLSALRLVTTEGGDMAVCGLTQQVRYLLELVRLHKIVDVYQDREEALRIMGR